MKKLVRLGVVVGAGMMLSACASSYQLSAQVKNERDHLTTRQAESVLAREAALSGGRGGVCMIGIHTSTVMDPKVPVKVSGSKLTVTGYFAEISDVHVTGNVLNNTGRVSVKFKGTRGKVDVDATKLDEIRLLKVKNRAFTVWCPNVTQGYLVVMKTPRHLPDGAEISFNVTSKKDLDDVLAALTHLSPSARIVSGVGM